MDLHACEGTSTWAEAGATRTGFAATPEDMRLNVSISRADTQMAGEATTASETLVDEAMSGGEEAILRLTARLVPGFLIGVAVVQWIFNTISFIAKPGHEVDFNIYYTAALALRSNVHANIYDLNVLRGVAAAHHLKVLPEFPYLYPPFLAIVMQPLAGLPQIEAEKLWNGFLLVCWLACTLLVIYWLRVGLAARISVELAPVSRLWSRQWRGQVLPSGLTLFAAALGIFVSLTYEPLLHVLILGQISSVIFLLLLLVPWLMQKRLPEVAGIALALATMLKLFPILLIVYFLVRGKWRVALGAVIGFAGMGAATLMSGASIQPAIQAILASGTSQDHLYNNQALAQVPIWLFALIGHNPGPTTTRVASLAGYTLIAAVAAVFAVVVLSLTWRKSHQHTPYMKKLMAAGAGRETSDMIEILGYAWAISTMLLVSPILWQHYQEWELAPLAVCLGYALRHLAAGGTRSRRLPWRRESLILVVLLFGYLFSMNALPFNYDSAGFFSLDPVFFHVPLRPIFMLLRPLSAMLVWAVSGYLFISTTTTIKQQVVLSEAAPELSPAAQ